MFQRNPWHRLNFPVWKYLNQPLFAVQTVVNPWKFWRKHRRQHLETCWQHDSRHFLEMCWRLDCCSYPDFILYMLIEISLQQSYDSYFENN